jgi:hypothetical protein
MEAKKAKDKRLKEIEEKQRIKKEAYLLWEADGKPKGKDDSYWDLANFKLKPPFINVRRWTVSKIPSLDWLNFIARVFIPIAIFWGTQSFNKQQQEIAKDRHQQEVLIKYLEQISQLLLDKNLLTKEKAGKASTVARARTLSTLRELDDFRRKLLIEFLVDAKLITKETPVNSIEGPVIQLKEAHLNTSKFISAKFPGADLSEVNLADADLKDANLKAANLSGANLTNIKNLTNQQIKSACNWEEAYFARYWDAGKQEWTIDDEKQEAKIKELKEDKASDPKEKRDCDRWKA